MMTTNNLQRVTRHGPKRALLRSGRPTVADRNLPSLTPTHREYRSHALFLFKDDPEALRILEMNDWCPYLCNNLVTSAMSPDVDVFGIGAREAIAAFGHKVHGFTCYCECDQIRANKLKPDETISKQDIYTMYANNPFSLLPEFEDLPETVITMSFGETTVFVDAHGGSYGVSNGGKPEATIARVEELKKSRKKRKDVKSYADVIQYRRNALSDYQLNWVFQRRVKRRCFPPSAVQRNYSTVMRDILKRGPRLDPVLPGQHKPLKNEKHPSGLNSKIRKFLRDRWEVAAKWSNTPFGGLGYKTKRDGVVKAESGNGSSLFSVGMNVEAPAVVDSVNNLNGTVRESTSLISSLFSGFMSNGFTINIPSLENLTKALSDRIPTKEEISEAAWGIAGSATTWGIICAILTVIGLYFSKRFRTVATFIAEIVLWILISRHICAPLVNLVENLVKKMRKPQNELFRGGTDEPYRVEPDGTWTRVYAESEEDEDRGFLMNVVTGVLKYVTEAIFGISATTGKVVEAFYAECKIAFNRKLASYTVDWIIDLLKQFATWLGSTTGFTFIQKLGYQSRPELEELTAEVVAFQTTLMDARTFNADHGRMAKDLYTRALAAEAKISNSKEDLHYKNVARSLVAKIAPLSKKLEQSGVYNNGLRKEPVVIVLGGESGVGKSFITMPIILELLAHMLRDRPADQVRAQKDLEDFLYVLNPDVSFWDSWRNQMITLFDEAFQLEDSQVQNENIMNWLRMCNNVPFPLNSADLSDKGRWRFWSDALISTTNRLKWVFDGAYNKQAVPRRIDLGVYQTIKEKYCRYEGVDGLPTESREIQFRRLDLSKVPDMGDAEFSTDIYEWVEWDYFTGKPKPGGRVFTFDQLMDAIRKSYDNKQKLGDNITGWHKNFFKRACEKVNAQKKVSDRKVLIDSLVADIETAIDSSLASSHYDSSDESDYCPVMGEGTVGVTRSEIRARCKGFSPRGDAVPDEIVSQTAHEFEIPFVDAKKMYVDHNLKWNSTYRELSAAYDLTIGSPMKNLALAALNGVAAIKDILVSFATKAPLLATIVATVGAAAIFWRTFGQGLLKEAFPEAESTDPHKITKRVKRVHKRIARAKGIVPKVAPINSEEGAITQNLKDMCAKLSKGSQYSIYTKNSGHHGFVTFFAGTVCHTLRHIHDKLCELYYGDEELGVIADPDLVVIFQKVDSEQGFSVRWRDIVEPVDGSVRCAALDGALGEVYNEELDEVIVTHDLVFWNVAGATSDKPNIMHFYRMMSDPMWRRDKLYGLLYDPRKGGLSVVLPCNKRPGTTLSEVAGISNTYPSVNVYQYFNPSTPGDCGLLVMNADTTISEPRVLGMHFGGQETIRGKRGLCSVITRDMLQEALDCFGIVLPERPVVTEGGDSDFYKGDDFYFEDDCLSVDEELYTDITEHLRAAVGDQFSVEGIAPSMRVPTQTNIIPSALHPINCPINLGPSTVEPAKLAGTIEKEGDEMEVGFAARANYVKIFPPAAEPLAKDVTQSYTKYVFDNAKVPEDIDRVLTMRQAIEGTGKYAGLNRSTSAGYPYNQGIIKRGKKDYFGDGDEYDYSSDKAKWILSVIGGADLLIRAGIPIDDVFLDILKDERRKFGKGARLVSACSMVRAVLERMYFGDFICWYIENRIYNGSAIGVNPHSAEWTDIYNYLAEMSQFGIFGDFSAWDGNYPPWLALCALQVVEHYYVHSTEEDRWARSTLINMMMSSRHITNVSVELNSEQLLQYAASIKAGEYYHTVETAKALAEQLTRLAAKLKPGETKRVSLTVIYKWEGGMPSGDVLTTVFNSIGNNIVMRYCYWGCLYGDPFRYTSGLNSKQFESLFRLITFGDDNGMTIHPSVKDKITHTNLALQLAKLGMKYTDATKTGVAYNHIPITKGSFLKRMWIWNDKTKMWDPAQDRDTLREMTYWTKVKAPHDSAFNTACEALEELSYWGIPEFHAEAPTRIKAIRTMYGEMPPNVSYAQCYAAVRSRKVEF